MEILENYRERRHFADRVREIRLRQGLTQTELANRLGFAHPSSISSIELGRRPVYVDEVPMLAKALGCAISELLPDKENRITEYPLSRTRRLAALAAFILALQLVSNEGRAEDWRSVVPPDSQTSIGGEDVSKSGNDTQLVDRPIPDSSSLIWGDNCDPTLSEMQSFAGS